MDLIYYETIGNERGGAKNFRLEAYRYALTALNPFVVADVA